MCKINRQTFEARRESLRKYRQTEKFKNSQKRYYATVKGKASSKRRQAKYHATEKGKTTRIRAENKRRRDLGFIELYSNPFNVNKLIEWHHIDNEHVVALPKEIHNICRHPNIGTHRMKCQFFIDKIYGADDAGTDHQVAYV